jgi:hypothetical protein
LLKKLVSRAGLEPFNGVNNREVIDFITRTVRIIRLFPGWGARIAPTELRGLPGSSREPIGVHFEGAPAVATMFTSARPPEVKAEVHQAFFSPSKGTTLPALPMTL